MHEHLEELLHCTGWANDLLIDVLAEIEAEGRDIQPALTQLTHLLRAQDVWRGRVEKTDAAHLPLWERETLEACAARSEASTQGWLDLLRRTSAEDLKRPVAYTNTRGTPFETPLRQIMAHVINHSTHHRAQIVQLLRQAGFTPPGLDFIIYLRQQKPEA